MSKTKSRSSLLTKDTEKRLAYAISVFSGDESPSAATHRNEAKTVLSAYVVGQKPHIAAQRLLSWDCIDNKIPEQDLCAVSKERAAPFLRAAIGGYIYLKDLENVASDVVEKRKNGPEQEQPKNAHLQLQAVLNSQ